MSALHEGGEQHREAVMELARLTGDIALSHYRTHMVVETKGDGSPVTVADRAAETAAREWVRRRFPSDGVLGEEFGEERPEAVRRWIIDPIDGTKSFVRGVPLWGSLVALCEGERVLAGAAWFPAVGEMISAAPGTGCWWNERRCHVSRESRIDVATVLTTDERFLDVPERHLGWERVSRRAGVSRSWGDCFGYLLVATGCWWNETRCHVSLESRIDVATVLTTDERFLDVPERHLGWERVSRRAGVSRSWGDCFGYLLVATGRAEGMFDPILSPWDAAALQPIVTEAGGVFTDWEGRPTAFGGSAVATNAALAAPLRALLAGPT